MIIMIWQRYDYSRARLQKTQNIEKIPCNVDLLHSLTKINVLYINSRKCTKYLHGS